MIGVYTFHDIERGELTVEVDWDHEEAEATCKEINDFWSGAQDRLDETPEHEEPTTLQDRLGWAASKLILGELIRAGCRDDVEDTAEALAHFANPQLEGFCDMDGSSGITIKKWCWYRIDPEDFHADWARVEKKGVS